MPGNWTDHDPSRFKGLRDGDYGPFPIHGHTHFVKMKIEFGPESYSIEPEGRAACGILVPDWRESPKEYPIGGIVDCAGCIAEMREAQVRENQS